LACVPEERPGEAAASASAPATEAPASSKIRSVAPRRENPEADPVITRVFEDDFNRPRPGPGWRLTHRGWRIRNGRLCGEGARNHPAWLARRLPINARIEFDAVSESKDGDLKVEIWGDGKSFATTTSYNNATSYLFIFGGWRNSYHVLARLDEHASNRAQQVIRPGSDDPITQAVEPGKSYRFKVERADGKTVRWWVNGAQIHAFRDPAPLTGTGHDHLGFNDWEVPVCFDNLKITPLKE
jgi:hypothetical protein